MSLRREDRLREELPVHSRESVFATGGVEERWRLSAVAVGCIEISRDLVSNGRCVDKTCSESPRLQGLVFTRCRIAGQAYICFTPLLSPQY